MILTSWHIVQNMLLLYSQNVKRLNKLAFSLKVLVQKCMVENMTFTHPYFVFWSSWWVKLKPVEHCQVSNTFRFLHIFDHDHDHEEGLFKLVCAMFLKSAETVRESLLGQVSAPEHLVTSDHISLHLRILHFNLTRRPFPCGFMWAILSKAKVGAKSKSDIKLSLTSSRWKLKSKCNQTFTKGEPVKVKVKVIQNFHQRRAGES